ncbi:MAG: hypothetical protein KGZ62_01610 [Sulfurimonas sp.]|nr:hypothetical protein [Sulfurimonas sp.]
MRINLCKVFSLANFQIYWFIVVLAALYLAFGKVNTPNYILPILASLIAAGFVLHSVHYRWTSFVTIITVCHVIAYPVGTLLVMSLSSPSLAIEPFVWTTTPLGLWGMFAGMIGLMIGILLTRLQLSHNRNLKHNIHNQLRLTPIWFNVLLMVIILPLVIFYIQTGTFYHKDVVGTEAYNFENVASFGFMGYLTYISYIGTILQLRRYMITKSKNDLLYAIICIILPIIIMIPSGSRTNTIIVVIISLLYFIEHEKSIKIKYGVMICAVLLLTIMTLSIEAYRLLMRVNRETTFSSRLVTSVQYLINNRNGDEGDKSSEISRAILGRRLSDHHSAGYLMSVIPESFPHRGFADMDQFVFYLLPTLLRPQITLDYNYDAILMMDTYCFRPDIGGSSPMMIIGELYERFSWPGIIIGMAFIGFLLKKYDTWIKSGSIRGVMMWVMCFYAVVNMYTYSLLKIFTFATRQFIIFIFIAYCLEKSLSAITRILSEKRINGSKVSLCIERQ